MNAIRTLLRHSIDYAGLFPPAGLDMATAVANYEVYRTGPSAWALGRFVLPVTRLAEFEAAAKDRLPATPDEPWRLAALVGPEVKSDLALLEEFNRRQDLKGLAAADTVELKATSESGIPDIMRGLPPALQAYIEIPIDRDPKVLLAAMQPLGARAKVRTGGITRDAFPATSDLVRFMDAAIQAGVAFKATAGLHHPLRAEYRLTYEQDSACGTMFGFLNLFLAAAFLRAGIDQADAIRLLEEGSAEAFRFGDRSIGWGHHRLTLDSLGAAREEVVISFGSCSFTEPIEDLEALHLLAPGARQA